MSKKQEFKNLVTKNIQGTYRIPNGVTKLRDGALYYIDGITDIIVPNSVEELGWNSLIFNTLNSNLNSITFEENSKLKTVGKKPWGLFPSTTTPIITVPYNGLILPEGVTHLYPRALNSYNSTVVGEIVIPSTVSYIGASCFGSGADKTFRFLQPSGMSVELPDAGQGSVLELHGMFYDKSSHNITIYTDNETIKNYDYDADNVVATIYHLDGTLWE